MERHQKLRNSAVSCMQAAKAGRLADSGGGLCRGASKVQGGGGCG